MDVKNTETMNGAQKKGIITDQNGTQNGGNLKDGQMIMEGRHLFVLNVDVWTSLINPPALV